eukprot:gene15159-16717_t
MAHLKGNQVFVFKQFLPELEIFLRDTLANEPLSENANQQREQLLSKVESLIKPPDLPPPRSGKKMSTSLIGGIDDRKMPPNAPAVANLEPPLDPISVQREIARLQGEIVKRQNVLGDQPPLPAPVMPAPYASKKKQIVPELNQPVNNKTSVSSTSDDVDIYEKIPSEAGSAKYVDLLSMGESQNTPPPPVPERTRKEPAILRQPTIDSQDIATSSLNVTVNLNDLKQSTHSGPLKELRNNARIWCVLNKKKLYLFKQFDYPATQIIDMVEYDVHTENMSNFNFRLSRPGFPSVLLAACDEDDYRIWLSEFRKCKYEDLDDIMPDEFKNNQQLTLDDDGYEKQYIKDHNYERPIDLLPQIEELSKVFFVRCSPVVLGFDTTLHVRQMSRHTEDLSPTDVTYVDMQGGEDYVRPSETQSTMDGSVKNKDSQLDISYDADLPPVPSSSDEDHTDSHQDLKNRLLPALPSEDQVSGSFESLFSSSDEDELRVTEQKPRSSSGPPAYNVKSSERLIPDRRVTGSLTRQQEKSKFFSDPDAVHCGILHQRRILAVWQKRYCKVKDDHLICFRSADSDEKPSLEIHLPGYKIELCEKETWRSNSFKLSHANAETLYFAAETREQLMFWLNILVKEMDKEKFKDSIPKGSKGMMSAQPSGDTTSMNADSESTETSNEEADEDKGNEPQKKKIYRKHSTTRQKQQAKAYEDAKLQGYLYRLSSGHWQRLWCMVTEESFLASKTASLDQMEVEIAWKSARLLLPNEAEADKSGFFVMKLVSFVHEHDVLLLAPSEQEWKDWSGIIKHLVSNTSEDGDIFRNLPKLPKILKKQRKDKQKDRPRSKKPAKNGAAVTVKNGDVMVAQQQQQRQFAEFNCRMQLLLSKDNVKGRDVFCHLKHGDFILSNDRHCLDVIAKMPAKELSLYDDGKYKSASYVFTVQKQSEKGHVLSLDSKMTYQSLLASLWTSGARINGGEGSVAKEALDDIKARLKRRSVTFGDEPRLTESDENSLPKVKTYFIPDLSDPTVRALSDGENSFVRPRKLTRASEKSLSKSRSSTVTKSAGSRMSVFFRSLPRRNRKKHELPAESVDGLPKAQFSGVVKQIETNEMGRELLTNRVCKISGKIFYAYGIDNEVKPIFKVPLRNAAIEDMLDGEKDLFVFMLSSMEDHATFKFQVETKESFDKWSNALYMLDTKSNATGLSSRESLLDDTKGEAVDIEIRIGDEKMPPRSGSNSNTSLSSLLSKQAKALAGSEDDVKLSTTPSSFTTIVERKISEDVFHSNVESITLSGFLFEVNKTVRNNITSRTKIRRWCVLRKSWLEIYENEADRTPIRGIAMANQKLEVTGHDDVIDKYAMCLRSEDEEFILCANTEEDYGRWVAELKRILKKVNRRTSSDTAMQALKSASGSIRQFLSSSSLSGSGKRDSKRATIVLNEVDEKVVEKFTDDVESGNKISGILSIVMRDGKLMKPKKRVCTIRDGMFCIAKRSKPSKIIDRIDLSNVAILDECDVDKGVYRFRLDYDKDRSLSFQAVDHKTADNWMVGISMAILLERLTSGEKFPHQPDVVAEEKQDPLNFDYFDYDGDDDKIQPEIDPLGLVTLSPPASRDSRSSNSSNLSNDIKREIDRKISFGSNYLHPLSNLLESAFNGTPTAVSESSAPSSREGTLEREYPKGGYQRKSSGQAIIEERREDSEGEKLEGQETKTVVLVEETSEQAIDSVHADNVTKNGVSKSDTPNQVDNADQSEQTLTSDCSESALNSIRPKIVVSNDPPSSIQSAGSVSNAIAMFENIASSRKGSLEDSVFRESSTDPDKSQLEVQLSELLKEREALEKERNVMMDRLPVLEQVVRDAKDRKNSENDSPEKVLLKQEYRTTNNDMVEMKARLEVVNKRLKIIDAVIHKKLPKLSESFRSRTTVISPHVIV